MTLRFRWAVVAGVLALCGCGEAYDAGSIRYAPVNPKAVSEAQLGDKPQILDQVSKAVENLYGPSPREIKVPPGLDLPDHGKHLANYFVPTTNTKAAPRPLVYKDSATGEMVRLEGGYALYRQHCLHCHGLSGDGSGPTATYLWPRPRDFRPGKFKFTSTSTDKPNRSDLLRTINQGIGNSAMPAFDGLMTQKEIQQVIDYVIFLSARGESEYKLIGAAAASEGLDAETIRDTVQVVFDNWKNAQADFVNPPVPRVAQTPESIANGRSLFLGLQTAKGLQCVGCHGEKGDGNGKSFVPREVFYDVTFGGNPDEMPERLARYPKDIQTLWTTGSIDDWGNPLRAANLNAGMYKGGRRPLDLYWRISKGINGAKMPAHAAILKPEEIWDLVNFVLALPYDPDLLKDAPSPPATAPATTALTTR